VPVAYEIAKELNAPLDIFIVRKLGVPIYDELAMGAIASGGVRVLNEGIIRRLGVTPRMIDAVAAEQQRELERREHEYRGDRAPLDVTEGSSFWSMTDSPRVRACERLFRPYEREIPTHHRGCTRGRSGDLRAI